MNALGDTNIKVKEINDIKKYDFLVEVCRIRENPATIVPVIILALDSKPSNKILHRENRIKLTILSLHESALLGNANAYERSEDVRLCGESP